MSERINFGELPSDQQEGIVTVDGYDVDPEAVKDLELQLSNDHGEGGFQDLKDVVRMIEEGDKTESDEKKTNNK